jgi:2-hydroxychromene-2-carboxylate isomerase
MIEQNNRPFVGKPVKLAYMWRDVERRAMRHGVSFNGIPDYPNDPEELATRVAFVAAKESGCRDFAKAAYACWFLENRDPGNVDNCCRCLRDWERTPRPS